MGILESQPRNVERPSHACQPLMHGLGGAFNRIRGAFNRLYVRWKELRGAVDRMHDPFYIGPTGTSN